MTASRSEQYTVAPIPNFWAVDKHFSLLVSPAYRSCLVTTELMFPWSFVDDWSMHISSLLTDPKPYDILIHFLCSSYTKNINIFIYAKKNSHFPSNIQFFIVNLIYPNLFLRVNKNRTIWFPLTHNKFKKIWLRYHIVYILLYSVLGYIFVLAFG